MSQFRTPEFLQDGDYPILKVRCPIYGFIHFSEKERKIIDHPLFQRLRHIRQLSLTEYIYPGANHTRFEHSLGVMEIATRGFDKLAEKNGSLIEDTLRNVVGFEKNPLAIARQLVRLAALTHDIGHCAFSHGAEKIVLGKEGHEKLSVLIIKEDTLLGGLINDLYGANFGKRIASIIEQKNMPPQIQFLHDIVSGELDADRTDYLLRDSYHCGVDYGRFDYRRMIECLEIFEGGYGQLLIGLHRGGIHAFEALILARYQMNLQVYLHRLRLIYDYYLEKYHESLEIDNELPNTPDKILENNDTTMISKIFEDAKNKNGQKGNFASRIKERRHHRVVYETGTNTDHQEKIKVESLKHSLVEKYPDIEFIILPAQGNIHKLAVPGSLEEGIHLPLRTREKIERYVGEDSQIFGTIPRRFLLSFIFADINKDQTKLMDEIKIFINKQR